MPISPAIDPGAPIVHRPAFPLREFLTVGMLPSGVKQWVYRRRGYRIGRHVIFQPGSLLIGSDVIVGDDALLAPMAVVRGESVRLARGASIGHGSVLAARRIVVGEDSQIENTVWVSSGRDRPDSRFEIGDFSILMRHSYVNCTAPVTIGDGSGIGGHCLLFTHGYWLNYFRGYPRSVAPIVIGRDVWLPWRVFIMPGTTIGDGSVIGANSLVQGEIPARSLAVGSPAVVRRTFPGRLDAVEIVRRAEGAVDELLQQLEGLGAQRTGETIRASDGRSYRIALVKTTNELINIELLERHMVVVSAVSLPTEWRSLAEQHGTSWFDLNQEERSDYQNPLGREMVAHLSGYGARFRRV